KQRPYSITDSGSTNVIEVLPCRHIFKGLWLMTALSAIKKGRVCGSTAGRYVLIIRYGHRMTCGHQQIPTQNTQDLSGRISSSRAPAPLPFGLGMERICGYER